jgi:hypothetical protein
MTFYNYQKGYKSSDQTGLLLVFRVKNQQHTDKIIFTLYDRGAAKKTSFLHFFRAEKSAKKLFYRVNEGSGIKAQKTAGATKSEKRVRTPENQIRSGQLYISSRAGPGSPIGRE